MAERKVWFGASLGGPMGGEVSAIPGMLERAAQADRQGLDLITLADHPYFGDKLDAYAAMSFLLGRTAQVSGAVIVTNPARPAALLARTVTSLSALSGGRIILGIGAGFLWDMIAKLGVAPRSPAAAVRAMAETITLVRELSGGGDPVTFAGESCQVNGIDPAPAPAPPVWTGAVGQQSLAVTGRLADGWVPAMGADWLSSRYRESRPVVDGAAAAAGRDPAEVITVCNFGGPITPAPLAATRDQDGRWAGGSAGQWVEELTGAVLEHGVGGFIYREGPTTSPGALAQWAQEIVPAVRAAVAAS